MKRFGQPARHRRGDRGTRRAVAAYVLAWLAGAALIAALLIAAVAEDDPENVSLPPLTHPELVDAARSAGCELRRSSRDEPLNPPVDGPPSAAPAHGGFYERAPDTGSLIAALRSGMIVIQFRPGIDDEQLETLRTVQRAVPGGTIVTPNDTGMPYELAVASYRRLLGCERLTDVSLEALRLFRGRFLGSGPEG